MKLPINVTGFVCKDQVGNKVYAVSQDKIENIVKQGMEPRMTFSRQSEITDDEELKPVVGIIGLPCLDIDGNKIYGVPVVIVDWVLRLGGEPRVIFPAQVEDFINKRLSELNKPTIDELEKLKEWVLECDAVIKPGCKRLYPHDNEIYSIASDSDMPYLGICGGMQLMRNHNTEYVANKKNETVINHQSSETYAHSISFVPGSKLQSILDTNVILVNSKHSYHIPDSGLKNVGAYADDGIIEALEDSKKLFNIGVQWHPELLQDDPNSIRLFSAFIDSAKKYQKAKSVRVF